jgi:hypothetical protein
MAAETPLSSACVLGIMNDLATFLPEVGEV